MHIERLACAASKCCDHDRTETDVRYEPSVHDVDMNPVGARGVDGANLLGKPREICRQNRGCYNDFLAGRVAAVIQFLQSVFDIDVSVYGYRGMNLAAFVIIDCRRSGPLCTWAIFIADKASGGRGRNLPKYAAGAIIE